MGVAVVEQHIGHHVAVAQGTALSQFSDGGRRSVVYDEAVVYAGILHIDDAAKAPAVLQDAILDSGNHMVGVADNAQQAMSRLVVAAAVLNATVAEHGVRLEADRSRAVHRPTIAEVQAVENGLRGGGEGFSLSQAEAVPTTVYDGMILLPLALTEVCLVTRKATIDMLRGVYLQALGIVSFSHPDIGVVTIEEPLLIGAALRCAHSVVGSAPRAAVGGVVLAHVDIYPLEDTLGGSELHTAESGSVSPVAHASHEGRITSARDKVRNHQESVGRRKPRAACGVIGERTVFNQVSVSTGAVPAQAHIGGVEGLGGHRRSQAGGAEIVYAVEVFVVEVQIVKIVHQHRVAIGIDNRHPQRTIPNIGIVGHDLQVELLCAVSDSLFVTAVVERRIGETQRVQCHTRLMAHQHHPSRKGRVVLVGERHRVRASRRCVGGDTATRRIAAGTIVAAESPHIEVVSRVGLQTFSGECIGAQRHRIHRCRRHTVGHTEGLPLRPLTRSPRHPHTARGHIGQPQPRWPITRGATADKGTQTERIAHLTIGQSADIEGKKFATVNIGERKRTLAVVLAATPHQTHFSSRQSKRLHRFTSCVERETPYEGVILIDLKRGIVPAVTVRVVHR